MFSDAAQKLRVQWTMMGFVLLCILGVCSFNAVYGAAMLIGAGLSYAHYYCMSKKQFGGITGDLAGYFVQISELVMAAAVWLAARVLMFLEVGGVM